MASSNDIKTEVLPQKMIETEQIEQKDRQLPVQDDEWFASEKSLTRKLDLTLIPMVWVLYIFNYLDRNNIAQARLDDFEADLGLVGNQFNVAVSILNVGYVLMQLPSNMMLIRSRPSYYIPIWVALWSIISASTAAVQNFSQLIAVRFFLGIAEAPFFPGAMYLLSCWYPRKQLARCAAILYSGLMLATAFSGLLAAGIFAGLDGARGIAGWQWLFIIEGAASFACAIVAVILIPDFPGQETGVAKWLLTEKEKKVAIERMALDRVDQPTSEASVWMGLKLAVKDVKLWIFALMGLANHNFFPSIVKGFDFGNTMVTLLLTAPPYLLSALVSVTVAISSDKMKERGYHISVPQIATCIGFIISVSTVNRVARYVSAFIYISGAFASNALIFSWAATSLSQTVEKRACATAIINILGQFGNIYSPYFFPSDHSPRYVMAFILMTIFSGIAILGAVLMKMMLKRENKKIMDSGIENPKLFQL